MSWKTAYRSFYYANAEEPADIALEARARAFPQAGLPFCWVGPV